jgi:hypothetical protein
MNRNRLLLIAVVTLLIPTAGYFALRALGVFEPVHLYRPVPSGHQEIVFLAPATSVDAWERLVAAVDALYQESQKSPAGKPRLQVNKDRAFVELTADVPEVALWVDGSEDARLWIRWYKLSGEVNTARWINLLTERETPPLAVIGGDTSSRALKVARALEEAREQKKWQGPAPVLMITTATVDRYIPQGVAIYETTNEKWPLLIDIYKGRSFRFSFTNTRMAKVVLEFIRTQDKYAPDQDKPWPHAAPALESAAGAVLGAAGQAAYEDLMTTQFYNLKWDDDSFSADLSDRFGLLFEENWPRSHSSGYRIEYSAGDFYQPNPREAFVVGQIMPELRAARERRQLMLLPCNAERARRLLRTLLRRAPPQDWHNLVVMTGDSLNFNTIFRDRDVAWNIQDLPVPLVLFSHRNPVSEEVGFKVTPDGSPAPGATGTEDLLLYRDILESLLVTAYQGNQLTPSAEELQSRLKQLRWHNDRVLAPRPGDTAMLLFNPVDGNRNDGTGEHVIVLRPDPDDRGVYAQATITVWHIQGDPSRFDSWSRVRTLVVSYDTLASNI